MRQGPIGGSLRKPVLFGRRLTQATSKKTGVLGGFDPPVWVQMPVHFYVGTLYTFAFEWGQRVEETEGFEPSDLPIGGFQDRCLQPLGHVSVKTLCRPFLEGRPTFDKSELSFLFSPAESAPRTCDFRPPCFDIPTMTLESRAPCL